MTKLKLTYILTMSILLLFLSSCGNSKCPKCNGTGDVMEEYTATEEYQEPKTHSIKEDCYRCNGRGKVVCTYETINSGPAGSTSYDCHRGKLRKTASDNMWGGALTGNTCPSCGGDGYDSCSNCSGRGSIRSRKTTYTKKTKRVTKERKIKDPYCSGTGFVSNFSEMFK